MAQAVNIERIMLIALRIRYHGLRLIRVSAYIRIAIHGCGYVIVGLAGDYRVVGVCGRTIERSVDQCVGAARHIAAVNVIADRVRRAGPSEVDAMLNRGRSRTSHRLRGGRVRGVARE